MANRIPLVANSSTNQIQELAILDNLDLSQSGIVNAVSIASTNLDISGISTFNSISIGATQIVSSARQLQNIASLDATTTATIESAIANAPNTFTNLNITGFSTLTNASMSGILTTSAGTLGSNGNGTRYVSTANPTGGNNGDLWYKVSS